MDRGGPSATLGLESTALGHVDDTLGPASENLVEDSVRVPRYTESKEGSRLKGRKGAQNVFPGLPTTFTPVICPERQTQFA